MKAVLKQVNKIEMLKQTQEVESLNLNKQEKDQVLNRIMHA